MNALAMDLGGSGGKIFTGRFDGKKIAINEIHRFRNEPVDVGDHLYWDIQAIYANLLEGIRKAAPNSFSSFGVDSFCNDYGLLDQGGKLFSPVYMYRDRRTEGIPEKVDITIPPSDLYNRTGCQRARFNTLVQLVAQINSPKGFLLDNAQTMLFVPDLLNYFLCGEKTAEYTIASVSQVYNRLENNWDNKIIQAFNLPKGLFPSVIPSSVLLGQARKEILDNTGAPPFSICTVGHHDTASAVVAVPNREKHFAYISSGTWSLMGTETDTMITTEESLLFNFANEGGVGGKNRFLKNIMGLWLLQECMRQFASMGLSLSYAQIDLEAGKVKPFRSLINPDDPIFFEPGDMFGKIQMKCREWNQPIPKTPGEVNRCIKESLALTYRLTLERILKIVGFEIPYVHIIGGGAQSTLLNQFAASAMGRPVLAGPIEAAAIGNLSAQFIAAGEVKDVDEARHIICKSFEIDEYLPERNAGWDEAYIRFRNICSI